MSLIFRLVLFLHLIGVLGFVGLMWSFGIGLTRIQQFDNVEVVRSWVTMARTCNRQASWFFIVIISHRDIFDHSNSSQSSSIHSNGGYIFDFDGSS